jgi:uncharacterized protein YeaO (DUF488 family)
MGLIVHTAHLSKGGPEYLDITRAGAERSQEPGGHRGMGAAFAPSRPLLNTYLHLAKRGALTDRNWLDYATRYLDEMRVSYKSNRAAWDKLLSLQCVTLCCACRDGSRCHRRLLAEDVLKKMGATYMGEL